MYVHASLSKHFLRDNVQLVLHCCTRVAILICGYNCDALAFDFFFRPIRSRDFVGHLRIRRYSIMAIPRKNRVRVNTGPRQWAYPRLHHEDMFLGRGSRRIPARRYSEEGGCVGEGYGKVTEDWYFLTIGFARFIDELRVKISRVDTVNIW